MSSRSSLSSSTPTNKKKKEAMTTSNFCATYTAKIKEVKELSVMIDANEDIEKTQLAWYKECKRIEAQLKNQLLSMKQAAICLVENVEELEALINVPNNIISKIIQIENSPSV